MIIENYDPPIDQRELFLQCCDKLRQQFQINRIVKDRKFTSNNFKQKIMKSLNVITLLVLFSNLLFSQKTMIIPDFDNAIPFNVEMIGDTTMIKDCPADQMLDSSIVGFHYCCAGIYTEVLCYYQKDINSQLIKKYQLENVLRDEFKAPIFFNGDTWFIFKNNCCETFVRVRWNCVYAEYRILENCAE